MGNTLTIFDLDNTLIQGDSSTVWSQFMVREGLATQKGYLAREARLMADYDRGEMNIADYVALIQAPLAGIPKSDVDALVARCVREAILPRVYPQAWELIRRLRAEGEQMLIISASVSLLVQAVAAALEIDQALGIDVAMVDGGYSGESWGSSPSLRFAWWSAACRGGGCQDCCLPWRGWCYWCGAAWRPHRWRRWGSCLRWRRCC